MKNWLWVSLSLLSFMLFTSFQAEAQRKKKKKTIPKTDTSMKVMPSPGLRNKEDVQLQKDEAMKQKRAALPWAVSFISIGSGIDYKTEERLLALYGQFCSEGCSLGIKKTMKGREGERDYCFSSADTDCMLRFREAVDKLIAGSKLILLLDEQPCN